jgi:hypothetical protein
MSPQLAQAEMASQPNGVHLLKERRRRRSITTSMRIQAALDLSAPSPPTSNPQTSHSETSHQNEYPTPATLIRRLLTRRHAIRKRKRHKHLTTTNIQRQRHLNLSASYSTTNNPKTQQSQTSHQSEHLTIFKRPARSLTVGGLLEYADARNGPYSGHATFGRHPANAESSKVIGRGAISQLPNAVSRR